MISKAESTRRRLSQNVGAQSGSSRAYGKTNGNMKACMTVTAKPFKGSHFATFPPDLIEPCILAGSRVGGIVLDPFLGSGTTAAAAKRLKREYIGIELNKEYKPLIDRRIAEEGGSL